ncbi:unnamed protein product, partial [Meganyctiphanes norvegica]
VNLTLDFPEGYNEETLRAAPPLTNATTFINKSPNKANNEEVKKANNEEIKKVEKQQRQLQQKTNNTARLQHQHSQGSNEKWEKGRRLRDTLSTLSTTDVSNTLQQLLPARIFSYDSHQSINSSSKGTTPSSSPSFFQKRSFRFSSLQKKKSKSVNDNLNSTGGSTPNISQSNSDITCEADIMAFQRQLQNLPSYERMDNQPHSPPLTFRQRSRSVPRVTFESMSTLMVPRPSPIVRSPSASQGFTSNLLASQLGLTPDNFLPIPEPSLNLSNNSLRPSLSAHNITASTPLHSPRLGPPRSLSSPTPSNVSSSSRPFCNSPFLSPGSPYSQASIQSPRFLSPALS